ncbi:MAG: aminoacyl-tRNA hydrolase [Pirellulales bacterium]
MKLVIGLGNPGRKYAFTRHNVGFDVIERLASRHGAEPWRRKFDAEIAEALIGGERALLMRPQTLMNRSGQAVQAAVAFYKLPLEDLLVVCDDFNLPLGRLRIRTEGSSGGQKGLQNITQLLGTQEIARLRIGIGPVPTEWDAADFVLGKLTRAEQSAIAPLIDRSADAVRCCVERGVAAAMNEYNALPAEAPSGDNE